MKKKNTSRRGVAAVEFAMILSVLLFLLFFLIEGAHAMHAYSNLVEASREGARLVLMEGDAANVDSIVAAMTHELDPNALNTAVSAGSESVTVEVQYEYEPFNENIFVMLTGKEHFQLSASSTMPLP